MYRCAVCRDPSKPREPKRVYTIKRKNGQIAQELPVCHRCKKLLTEGVTLKDLVARFQPVVLLPAVIRAGQPTVVGKAVPERQSLFS